MTFLIKHFAPFWAMKRAIIKAALAGMSDTGKELMLKEVIASQLPKMCLGHRPYQKNGKKAFVCPGTITTNTDGEII